MVYLFKRKGSRVTHGVCTKWESLGSLELDLLFGGGLYIICTNTKGEGEGVLSPRPMSTGHITCKKCLARLKNKGVRINKKPKSEIWPPKKTRPLEKPRILGIM